MAAASGTAYTYSYQQPSALVDVGGAKRLELATSADAPSRAFFEGRLCAPRRTADALLTISDVVGSRFHTPSAMLEKVLRLADPVFTCSEERLRFEGFSACCGAYARLDLLPNAYEGRVIGRGTSNVDFGADLRAELGRVRDGDELALGLRADAFELRRQTTTVVERKVTLPARWLRGFAEVQAYQAAMTLRLAVSGVAFRQFLRDVPAQWKGTAWLGAAGDRLRLTEHEHDGHLRVGGVTRLRVLRAFAQHAGAVRIFAAGDSGTTAWEITTADSRLFLVLSPDVWRGFSGEGQTLDAASRDSGSATLARVRAHLRWQTIINPSELARDASLEPADADRALALCASSGLVGYDLAESAYFHRELPFDVTSAERALPRLRNATKLIRADAIRFEEDAGDGIVRAWVASAGVEYRVTLTGDEARCTCPWYAKHRQSRGPCKHVIAVRMQR